MISKSKIKLILSLQKKKIREEKHLYVIEGDKLIKEHLSLGKRFRILAAKPEFVSSLLPSVAVVPFPDSSEDSELILRDLCIALECIQDPGNLGTIIRSAAWFGIKDIVCSPDCADLYNPKVLQASMGAFLHVKVFYLDLKEVIIKAREEQFPVFGALMKGESIYHHKLDTKGLILLGNESKGLSEDLIPYLTHKITIPGFSRFRYGIDSLNVSMAAAVILSEFARRRG
jgi:RNA methyltransferase, TrmH family